MADALDDLKNLLAAPRESLSVELKQWIDPTKPEGIAKIAKGCIALRNNNGGRLIIGFKDDGSPDLGGAPPDVEATFHVDVVQGIVSKYSAESFAVEVTFVEHEGSTYPVVSVPPGVRTPVAAKSGLQHNGTPLIRDNAVYVRSLQSNNTVSSSDARRGDWDTLTRICFDNREADIGGFVRRHLASLNLEALASLIPGLLGKPNQPSLEERGTAELDRCRARFDAEIQKRKATLPKLGFRESIAIVQGEFPKQPATEAFKQKLLASAPRHSGWPPFLELYRKEEHRPYVLDQGWEALVMSLTPAGPLGGSHLDFWRMEPKGVFYSLTALQDDLAGDRGPEPGTQLDFGLEVVRLAEFISTGLSFGRSLGCDETKTSIEFGFRWTGLAGRELTSWSEPRRMFRSRSAAMQDTLTTLVTVPLETPPNGVAPHVHNALRELFALFGGMSFEDRVIEDIALKFLKQPG